MTTAAIYTRISDDRAGQQAGVRRQQEECRTLAEKLGFTVGQIYTDNDLSATSGVARPAFERLLADRPEVLLVWHVDRLCRVSKDLERVLDVGLTVHSVMSGHVDLSTPPGRATARTITAWAGAEIEMKNARQKAAREQRLKAGMRAGGQRPWGYSLAMEPIPAEAEAVKECYRRVLADHSLGSIARWLNSQGLLTPRGREWQPGNLGQALRKGCYVGLLEVKGRPSRKAAWPAIVNRKVWERAQVRLNDPSRRKNVSGTQRQLLTGVGLCGICRATLHGGGSGVGVGVYRCSATAHLAVKRAPIDEHVLSLVEDIVTAYDQLELSVEVETPAPSAEVTAELEKLEAQRVSLARNLTLPEDLLEERAAALDEAIAELRAAIVTEPVTVNPARLALDKLLPMDGHETRGAAFLAAGTETQRRVIQEMGLRIVVHSPGRGARGFDPSTVKFEMDDAS